MASVCGGPSGLRGMAPPSSPRSSTRGTTSPCAVSSSQTAASSSGSLRASCRTPRSCDSRTARSAASCSATPTRSELGRSAREYLPARCSSDSRSCPRADSSREAPMRGTRSSRRFGCPDRSHAGSATGRGRAVWRRRRLGTESRRACR